MHASVRCKSAFSVLQSVRKAGLSYRAALPKFPLARPEAAVPPLEYARLRANDRVSQVELWDGSLAWLVVKHKDICSVLETSNTNASLLEYMAHLVEERLSAPKDDLIGLLVSEQLKLGHITKDDVV